MAPGTLTAAERAECELIGRLVEAASAGSFERVCQLLADYEEGMAERMDGFGLFANAEYQRATAKRVRDGYKLSLDSREF